MQPPLGRGEVAACRRASADSDLPKHRAMPVDKMDRLSALQGQSALARYPLRSSSGEVSKALLR